MTKHWSAWRGHDPVKTLGQIKPSTTGKKDSHHRSDIDDQKCGTANKYRCGCRCQECKDAMNLATNANRARRLLEGRFDHGTQVGYYVGCRCDACIEAALIYRKSLKAKKHELPANP